MPAPATPAAAGFPLLLLSLSSFQSCQAADFPVNLKAQSCRAGRIKAREMGQQGSHGKRAKALLWDQSPAQEPHNRTSHPQQHCQASLHQGFSRSIPEHSSSSSRAQPLHPITARSPPSSYWQNAALQLLPTACAAAGGHPRGYLPPGRPEEELQPVQVPVPRAP